MNAPWIQSFLNKYRAGVSHTFALHHNIHDYVDHSNTLRTYLAKLFADREIVVTYDKANGLTFPLVTHRENFEAATKTEPPADVGNPLAAFMKGDPLPKETIPALLKIDHVLRRKRCAVILDHAETLFPAVDFAQMSDPDRRALVTLLYWAKDANIASYGSPIILLATNLTDLHPALRTPTSRVEAVTVPYPLLQERQEYLEHLLDEYSELKLDEGMDIRGLSNGTAGLNKILIEDIILRALSEPAAAQEPRRLTHALVKERKEDIICSEFGDVLEIVEPAFGFEAIGGLEHVKTFIRSSIIAPLRSGDAHRCPMGVLMTGPAGTGKSAIAEATAKEAGVNFVNLNLARILGQYVGNSERNLEKALLAIENLAPTIVLIDEIDQSVQRGGQGDSGVSNRIFKRLLEFMSDTSHRGKVVFLAATNRPDLMDAAMKRAGRFDKKIPFFPPDTDEERAAIFRALFTKTGVAHEIRDLLSACRSTDGYSGADLEAIVIKAVEIARDGGRGTVTDMDLTLAARTILPSAAEDVAFMTDLALKEVNDISLVPAKYLERVKALRRASAVHDPRS